MTCTRTLRSRRQRARGFSIVEMMVAIVVGLILVAGAISMLVTSKRTYTIQDDLGRIQENARFALEYLARDLRMAGYFGCAHSLTDVYNHVNSPAGSIFDTTNPVEGYEQDTAAWLPSGSVDVGAVSAGTDAITVRYLEPSNVAVTVEMAQTGAPLTVTVNNGLKQGDVVAVSDCTSSDVFQISGPAGTAPSTAGTIEHDAGGATAPGNTNAVNPGCGGANPNCYSKVYGTDAFIHKLAGYRYYVGTDANGNPALFREAIDVTGAPPTAAPNAVQLIDGVENMQISYGVDTSGDRVPDVYLPANGSSGTVDLTTAAGWNSVISARVVLLLRSPDTAGTDVDDRTYTVGTEVVGPFNDRRRRRVFGTTVLMRNLATLTR
ncbi:MAG: PilW family protein [Gammaproteobacteria bacterium]|nr:PilW family protein [Gammaproteobacteria bacterium]